MSKETIDSPIGPLSINESDAGEKFAQGYYQTAGERLFVSMNLGDAGTEAFDFDFVRSRLQNAEKYTALARKFLIRQLGIEADPDDVALIDSPEFTFWSGLNWSILFSQGTLDICEPYGVIVNFEDDVAISFDDLSGAEEV